MKTNSDWLSGAGEAAAIDASPPPKTSTSCDNSDFLGGAKTFGTAPWAQQSVTAGSGSRHNTSKFGKCL